MYSTHIDHHCIPIKVSHPYPRLSGVFVHPLNRRARKQKTILIHTNNLILNYSLWLRNQQHFSKRRYGHISQTFWETAQDTRPEKNYDKMNLEIEPVSYNQSTGFRNNTEILSWWKNLVSLTKNIHCNRSDSTPLKKSSIYSENVLWKTLGFSSLIVCGLQYWNLPLKVCALMELNSVTNSFCSETLFSYPLDSNVYSFAWLLQSTYKLQEIPETAPNSCLTSISPKGSSF